jgi:hypothetical protein
MRDHLLDLVEHTLDLGCIDLVRIIGTDTETAIDAVAEDRSVVVKAEFAEPVADFMGTFGMPNLSKLKIMLNLQEYKENAVLRLTKNAAGEPDGVEFQNALGDFKNSYRFMSGALVNGKLKTVTFKGVPWTVEFTPTVSALDQALSDAKVLLFEQMLTNLKPLTSSKPLSRQQARY